MSRWIPVIFALVAFDVLWAVTMFGAGRAWWPVGPVLIAISMLVQLRPSPSPRREALVILVGAAIGAASDALLLSLGQLAYTDPSRVQFAIVFLALWVNFGTTLRPALRWMWHKPLLAALLGGIGGPLAYFAGDRIGAIDLAEPTWRTLLFVSLQYAVLTPLWMLLADRIMPAQAETDPSTSSPAWRQT